MVRKEIHLRVIVAPVASHADVLRLVTRSSVTSLRTSAKEAIAPDDSQIICNK